jgi:hypothetical protein
MGALANPEETMAIRAAMLLCLMLFFMPVGFGVMDDPEPAEFNFVRLQYNSGAGSMAFTVAADRGRRTPGMQITSTCGESIG